MPFPKGSTPFPLTLFVVSEVSTSPLRFYAGVFFGSYTAQSDVQLGGLLHIRQCRWRFVGCFLNLEKSCKFIWIVCESVCIFVETKPKTQSHENGNQKVLQPPRLL